MAKNSPLILMETALFAGLAMILDILTQPLMVGPWMSISFKMVPIFILAFRRGTRPAVMAGFIWGLLQIVLGQAAAGWLTLFQGLLDYLVAFSLVGLAGLVAPAVQANLKPERLGRTLTWMVLGIFIGSLARYSIHFLTGVIFFGSYAAPGQSALVYSLTVNGISCLGECLASSLVLGVLLPFLKRFLRV